MNVSDVIIKTLEHLGVRMAFGIPGGTISTISNALAHSHIIKTLHTHHETGAAYMALGRSLCTQNKGELGLCFGCSGPGATNLITGVASAYAEKIPLFVLTGNVAIKLIGKGAAQDGFESGINVLKMFEPITCRSMLLKQNTNVESLVKELYELALKEKRPVHLNVPIDVASMTVLENNEKFFAEITNPIIFPEAKVAEAVNRFLEAKRPLIFCGNGVKVSENKYEVMDFASRLAIPAISSSHAKGVFYDSHEYYFGNFGFAANSQARSFLNHYQPDAVIFLGTRLGEVATEGWSPLLDNIPLKIHVDIDDKHFNSNYKVEYGLKIDIAEFLKKAIAVYEKDQKNLLQNKDQRINLLREYNNDHQLNQQPCTYDSKGPIKPDELMQALNELLPDDAYIFSDIGNSMAWLLHDFKVKAQQDLYVPVGLGAMGTSICMSIGVKSALENRPVICITGDCAALMHGMELFTAKRANYGVKFIILNDGGHGMVSHGKKLQGLECDDLLFEQYLDFSKLGEFFGIESFFVKSLKEFAQLPLKAIFNSNKPVIIDLFIDRETFPPIAGRLKALNHTG